MSQENMEYNLESCREEINRLRDRVNLLELRAAQWKELPKSALLNKNFLARAAAVWGHNFVISLLIAIPFWVLGLIIFLGVTILR
jgi:hypothetical protein